MSRVGSRHARPLTFAACISLPSIGEVQKWFGPWAVAGYLAVVLAAVYAADRRLEPFLRRRVPRRAAVAIAFAGIVFACGVALYIHPLADDGLIGGGSDSDNALNIAVEEITAGRYPYYAKTGLGNPILPAPGAIIFAMPFVWLGDVAYQNPFWLCVFFVLLWKTSGDSRTVLVVTGMLLLLSPAVMQQMVSGSDKFANAAYVLLAVLLVAKYVARGKLGVVARLAPCLFLGLALSSRANYLLLLPPLCVFLWRRAGLRWMLFAVAGIVAGFVTVTAPFYLYDPGGYSPLQALEKATYVDSLFPYASSVLLIGSATASLGLAALATDAGTANLIRNTALVQIVPTFGVVIFNLIGMGIAGLVVANYGFSFALSGIAAAMLYARRIE